MRIIISWFYHLSRGHLFIFHRKNTVQNSHGEFPKFTDNSPMTNVSLYYGEKQSDKWSDITAIFQRFFSCACHDISKNRFLESFLKRWFPQVQLGQTMKAWNQNCSHWDWNTIFNFFWNEYHFINYAILQINSVKLKRKKNYGKHLWHLNYWSLVADYGKM